MSIPYAEVIGDPIGHSKSPLIHRFWLEALAIEGDYRAVQIGSDTLPGYLLSRRGDPDWRGCNVTAPLKGAVIEQLDRLDLPGELIGAVNTVLPRPDGKLDGTNTDADGFNEPLRGMDLKGKHAVLFGAGGAARAVLALLQAREVGLVTLVARSHRAAIEMMTRSGQTGIVQSRPDPLPPADLLVNATPLGMAGQAPLSLDLSNLPPHAIVYDLVYHPLETALLRDARRRGLMTIDGLSMLIGQAALAFELFFGASPPRACDAELRARLTS